MTDPISTRTSTPDVLQMVLAEAKDYLDALDTRPVRSEDADAALAQFELPLPERGHGPEPTLEFLTRTAPRAATHSSGPRFFHFVIGGATPAALGADWLCSLLDQNAGLWASSPLAATLERVTVGWLLDLFGLPADWGGVLTSSATLANFTALGTARHWWADKHGVDVDRHGLVGLPAMPVLSGGYVHPSARRALQLLGVGRDGVATFAADETGRLDIDAMERALRDLGGAPAVIVANAGEVNTGAFDPIADLADLAERYDAWLHVDGAFGLFAALSPRSAHLVDGIRRAHSVIADGHKWLNVPYESGFAFVRDPTLLGRTFAMAGATYLPLASDPNPNYAYLTPESSRRARALPIWATLHAYGREGYRAMVERHLDLAQYLADRVRQAPDLELLADPQLCIVCFRYRPAGVSEERLNDLNRTVGERLLADGRVYTGTTTYRGHVAFRPAIVNWRTSESDLDLLIEVIREIGSSA